MPETDRLTVRHRRIVENLRTWSGLAGGGGGAGGNGRAHEARTQGAASSSHPMVEGLHEREQVHPDRLPELLLQLDLALQRRRGLPTQVSQS
eukprot:COSAG01_NODE_11765_length_1863_cov_2.423469_1_plen_92_part_00